MKEDRPRAPARAPELGGAAACARSIRRQGGVTMPDYALAAGAVRRVAVRLIPGALALAAALQLCGWESGAAGVLAGASDVGVGAAQPARSTAQARAAVRMRFMR